MFEMTIPLDIFIIIKSQILPIDVIVLGIVNVLKAVSYPNISNIRSPMIFKPEVRVI